MSDHPHIPDDAVVDRAIAVFVLAALLACGLIVAALGIAGARLGG